MIEVTIDAYADFYTRWWGLEDGTLLEVNDTRGDMWVKVNGVTMTLEKYLGL